MWAFPKPHWIRKTINCEYFSTLTHTMPMFGRSLSDKQLFSIISSTHIDFVGSPNMKIIDFEKFVQDDLRVNYLFAHVRNVGMISLVFGASGWKYVHVISVYVYSIITFLVIFGLFLMLVAFKEPSL